MMFKPIIYLKQVANIFWNTIRYNLWKATIRKIFEQTVNDELSNDALDWYKNTSISINEFATQNSLVIDDRIITDEMHSISEKRKNENSASSNKNPKRKRMGGFGNAPVIFSIVRGMQRKTCLECGVSMGASSYAILKALEENQSGVLLSSDLPYLWIKNPIKKIGFLIPENLKHRWSLFVGDDKDNLPIMIKALKEIDFAHYDSNKSYQARVFFFNLIKDNLSEDCVIIFDDIIDNDHFFDLSQSLGDNWEIYVICDEDKHIGVLKKNI